jgi:hypothetical protein
MLLESSLGDKGNIEIFQKSWFILQNVNAEFLKDTAFYILEKIILFIKEYSPNIPTLNIIKTILENN